MKKVISLLLSIVMLLGITAGIDFSACAAVTLQWPVPGHTSLSQGFHDGNAIDISDSKISGADIYAALGGTVTHKYTCKSQHYGSMGDCDGFGTGIVIKGTDGRIYQYAHMKGGSIPSNIYVGASVKTGQLLGKVGTTGNSSGNHLHFGISYNNFWEKSGINPSNEKYNYSTPSSTSTVKITFKGNGGTVSTGSLNVSVGKIMGSNTPTAVRSGYTFEGWYTSASGGTKYTNSTPITSGNKTLYAHWTKNQTSALMVGGVYRILNVKSMRYLQTTGSSNHSLVKLQNESNSLSQYWRVTSKDSNGYYQFQTMNGGKLLDVDTTNGRYKNGNNLQIYEDNGSGAQKFSIIDRSSGYSIHNVHSGRALDCKGAETAVGTQLQQYYYTGNPQQLFRFCPVTDRAITYYDNLNNNYLPTPREEYNNSGSSTPKDCYYSRNTDTVTVTLNNSQNMIMINSKKIGSSGNDITFSSTLNGSYNYDMYNKDMSARWLIFRAKSSVSGAKMYFRWGYDPSSGSNVKSVTLSNSYQVYKIELPRTINSGSNIHSWIDKVCTVQMDNIRLVDSGVTDACQEYGYSYTGKTNRKIYISNGTYYSIPKPINTPKGYIFDGWYTKRVGGTKVTTSTSIGYNQKLYAHWVKATESNHTHSYDGGTVTRTATCTTAGIKTYTCTICGKSKTETIPVKAHTVVADNAVPATCTTSGKTAGSHCSVCGTVIISQNIVSAKGHSWNGSVITVYPSCTVTGVRTYTCTACGTTKTEAVAKKPHTYKTYTSKAAINKNGSVVTKCTVCGAVKSKSTVYYPKTIKLSKTSYTYNGKVQTPSVTVKDSKGKTLKKNTDYTVTYAKGRKNVGKYAVKITFKGKYSGSKTLYYTIKPKATSLSKLTAGKKRFVAKWKKQTSQTTGYQIQYSTNKNFKSAKTVTVSKNKTTSKSITKLKAKKKYYVRIRTYKIVEKTKYYSSWSKAKAVTTKK